MGTEKKFRRENRRQFERDQARLEAKKRKKAKAASTTQRSRSEVGGSDERT
jgi:hypothetical protein